MSDNGILRTFKIYVPDTWGLSDVNSSVRSAAVREYNGVVPGSGARDLSFEFTGLAIAPDSDVDSCIVVPYDGTTPVDGVPMGIDLVVSKARPLSGRFNLGDSSIGGGVGVGFLLSCPTASRLYGVNLRTQPGALITVPAMTQTLSLLGYMGGSPPPIANFVRPAKLSVLGGAPGALPFIHGIVPCAGRRIARILAHSTTGNPATIEVRGVVTTNGPFGADTDSFETATLTTLVAPGGGASVSARVEVEGCGFLSFWQTAGTGVPQIQISVED